MNRTFTLDEANRLLPSLEPLLRRAMDSQKALQAAQKEIQEAGNHVFLSGGSLLNISAMMKIKAKAESAAERLQEALEGINSAGVQVKDLEIGLLDFPCQLNDEIILLCWKLGEPAIAYWHTLEAGFKGRQPIDERISRSKQRPS